MLGIVTGAVDFIDRVRIGEDGFRFIAPVRGCKRLWWWNRLVGNVARIGLSVPKKVVSFEKSFNWMRRQVAPTLAFLTEYLMILSDKVTHQEKLEDAKMFWLELYGRGFDRIYEGSNDIYIKMLDSVRLSKNNPHCEVYYET